MGRQATVDQTRAMGGGQSLADTDSDLHGCGNLEAPGLGEQTSQGISFGTGAYHVQLLVQQTGLLEGEQAWRRQFHEALLNLVQAVQGFHVGGEPPGQQEQEYRLVAQYVVGGKHRAEVMRGSF
jgi:hypothetical protein